MGITLTIWKNSCFSTIYINFMHSFMRGTHKYLLIEAEKFRVMGEDVKAMQLYDQAIESAREHEYINNQAIANELAAKYYLSKGLGRIAALYMKEAHYLFGLWGAESKVRDLEERYPEFITAVKSQAEESVSVSREHSSSTHSTVEFSSNLDLNTVMKATRAISGEIVLEKLTGKLLKIMVENAGAEKGIP